MENSVQANKSIQLLLSAVSNSAELLEKCVVQKDCEDVRELEAAWKYKHNIESLANKQRTKQLNQKDRETSKIQYTREHNQGRRDHI